MATSKKPASRPAAKKTAARKPPAAATAAALALNKARWSKVSAAERRRISAELNQAQWSKRSAKERKRIASELGKKGGAAITPEAARARAIKAYATRRANAAKAAAR